MPLHSNAPVQHAVCQQRPDSASRYGVYICTVCACDAACNVTCHYPLRLSLRGMGRMIQNHPLAQQYRKLTQGTNIPLHRDTSSTCPFLHVLSFTSGILWKNMCGSYACVDPSRACSYCIHLTVFVNAQYASIIIFSHTCKYIMRMCIYVCAYTVTFHWSVSLQPCLVRRQSTPIDSRASITIFLADWSHSICRGNYTFSIYYKKECVWRSKHVYKTRLEKRLL